MTESSAAPRPDDAPAGVVDEAHDDAAFDHAFEGETEDDGEVAAHAEPAARPSRGRRRRRDWWEGGSSVRRWGWEVFGWAVLSLGAALIASTALRMLVGGALGGLLGTVVLWIGFAVPFVLGLMRSRPRGLLAFRPVDLLYAVVLGGALRIVQGWLELAAGGTGAWPSYPSLGGSLPPGWFFDAVITSTIVAPVLEEAFFRGVVLVAVYSGVRRLAGRGIAAFAAALVSTALFVLAHAILVPLPWDSVVALTLLGLVNSILVLATGRLWPAVLLHVVYNGSWVALATVGTLLS